MNPLLQDLRYAVRAFRRDPLPAAIAVLVLALGTGANAAIFSVVYAALLRPLPVRNVDSLVAIGLVSQKLRVTGAQPSLAAGWKYQRESQSFESMAAAAPGTAAFGSSGDSTIRLWRVNAGFLPTLGVSPAAGRNFLPEEDQPGKGGVALVSASFRRGRLGAEANIPGAVIRADGQPYTVVGVLPEGFHVDGRPADVYIPLARSPQSREYLPVNLYARLKPGVTAAQAQAELDAANPANTGPLGWRPRIWSLREFQVRNVRLSLWILLGAAGIVVLIACANIATLLLARAGVRRQELATRVALGAGRGRLLRQLLTESGLLALAGGAGGVLVALLGVRLVPLLAHERLPGLLEQTRIDGAVLGYTLVLALATGLLFGSIPAIASVRAGVFEALRPGRGTGMGGRRLRWNLMVAAETALALVLAIGAGLLIRTFFYLRDVAPGFRVDSLLTVRITPPKSRFTSPAQCNEYWRTVIASLRAIPGVQSASFAQALPLTGDNWVGTWAVEGVSFAHPRDIPPMWQYFVEKDYFRTMQVPLRRGRFFSDRDDAASARVVIVGESFARRFWPGLDPIGRHIGGGQDPLIEVVGVVGDVAAEETTKSPPPELYFHFLQFPVARMAAALRPDPRVYRRPLDLEPAVRRAIAAADPARPPFQAAEMRQVVSDRIASNRLTAQLIAIFAGLALVLAAAGIYAVLAFTVARRTHEIGVRMALGATRGRILLLVLKDAAGAAGLGIAIGLAALAGLTRIMRSMLFGVAAGDPLSLATAAAMLLAVAVMAAAGPGLRAARLDPVTSLRQE